VACVDSQFFAVYGADIVAGRALVPADQARKIMMLRLGEVAETVNVVANRRMTEVFGFTSPEAAVGQTVTYLKLRLVIVGVVADQRFEAPSRGIAPSLYYSAPGGVTLQPTVVRFEGVSDEVMRARLRAVWRAVAPDLPIDLTSVSESLDYFYAADRRMTRLFMAGAAVVSLIGAVGLYGMAAFSTTIRAHEIGLRKAVGATRGRVARRLVVQFLRPVILANLAAWPLAWLVLDRWLGQFHDRVPMMPWFFLAGSGLSLTIAVMAVAGLALKASSRSPGQTLRHE
jgi:putative ABC transport system permease protein